MEASILGRRDLRRWCSLPSAHGARICTGIPFAFLLWAVVVCLSQRSLPLRPTPPCLFPPHISRTRCSAALNFLPSSTNFPLGTLTCSAGCLNCTQSCTSAVTHKERTNPDAIVPNGGLQQGHGKGGGRTPNFSTLPSVGLVVMAALVCQAT